jgi:hypothetical protein
MAARDVQKLAQLLHERGRVVARREVDEARNEFGTVVEAGASDVAIELHSSGITLTEDDLYFIGTSPAQLDEDDAVLVLAVGSEYAVVGSVETDPDKAASGGHVIQDEGTDLDEQPNLNFTGAAITVTDDPGNDATVVDVQAYTRVRDEGADLTKRSVLDFVGAGVSVTDVGGVTTVTVAGAADLSAAVILAPGSSGRNVVQPTGNFTPFTIRASASQTLDTFRVENSDGSAVLASFGSAGSLTIDNGDTSMGVAVTKNNIIFKRNAASYIQNMGGAAGGLLFTTRNTANSADVTRMQINAGDVATGALTGTAAADNSTPLTVSRFSNTQSVNVMTVYAANGGSVGVTAYGNTFVQSSNGNPIVQAKQTGSGYTASPGAFQAVSNNVTSPQVAFRAMRGADGAETDQFHIKFDGAQVWAGDTTLYRSAANVLATNGSFKLVTNGTTLQFPPVGANIQGEDGSGNSKMTFRAGNVGGNATVYVFRNKADSSDVVAITDGGQVSTIGNVNVSGTSGKAIILNVTSDTLRPNVQLSSNTNANASNLIEFYNTDSSGTVTGARSQEMRAYWRAQDNVSRWAAGMDFNLTATGATGDALGAQIVWRVKSPSEAAGTPTGRMWLDGHSGNAGSTNLSIAGGSYPRLTVGSGNYIERPNASSGLAIVTEALGLQVSGGPVAFAGGAGSKSALNLTSTTVNTGLTIGGDVTLYRSAANVLATDDSLTVDLNLTVNGNARLGNAASDTLGFFTTAGTAQSTGWSVTGGYTADKSFDPESTTTTEVARVLGTLIDAFKAYGLIAA